jgi:hypothetical protein
MTETAGTNTATPAAPESGKGGGFVAKMSATSRFEPRATVRWLDKALGWAKRVLSDELYEGLATLLVTVGHYGMLLAQVSCVFFGITEATKLSDVTWFFYGVGMALGLVVLQYTASRFLNVGAALIKTSPSRLGSPAFTDCTAWLVEVLGIVLFVQKIMLKDWSQFFQGLAIWAVCDVVAWIALNPKMLNISVSEDIRAGEEAIGIMSFFAKMFLRLVPMAFGIGSVIGGVVLLIGCFTLMKDGDASLGLSGLKLATVCVCLPLGSYVAFAMYNLGIDLMRAILVVPGKLDKLAGPRGE